MRGPTPSHIETQQRAERFATRAFAAEAKLAAVTALLDATDTAAAQHGHLARLSTGQIRDAIDNAKPTWGKP